MALNIAVGKKRFEIGSASFLKAWFSTVFVRLENEEWGSRFPTIMHDFYSGSLPHTHAKLAIQELEDVRRELANFPPSQVVWDFEDREAQPPWGDHISPHITSLANYFVTSDGKDLCEVLLSAFAEVLKTKHGITII